MNPNRIQLGFNLACLSGAGELSRQDVAGIVRIGLAALDNGADYIKVPADANPLLVNSLLALAGPALLLEGNLAAAERVVAGPHQPALFELRNEGDSSAIEPLCDAASAAGMEILVTVPAPAEFTVAELPAGVAGIALDARGWVTSSGAAREQQRQVVETALAEADDNELFAHLTQLPSVADGEEAATLAGVAGIEMGLGLLPLVIESGLSTALPALKRSLVDAQQGALAIALEEHDHHDHSHDHNHDHGAGCGCHH